MNRRITWVLTAAVLITGTLLLSAFFSGSSFADDNDDDGRERRDDTEIVWNPPRLDLSLKPNESVQLQIAFTAREKLDDRTTLFASTSLAEIVSVAPATFERLKKGQTATVTVSAKLSVLAQPGTTTGFIRLYEQEGQKRGESLSGRLPISIVTICPCVPPDPGVAGKATIEGIDSDGDGLRDDVQRYVAATYPDSAKARAALRQAAIYKQKALLTQTREQTRALIPEMARAQECLEHLGISDVARDGMQAIFINTPERYRAWTAGQARISGASWKIGTDWKASCAFDPDKLQN